MYYWCSSIQISSQFFQQKSYPRTLLRPLSINPIIDMIMLHFMSGVSFSIFQLDFFNFDVRIFGMDIIFQHSNNILVDYHDAIVVGELGVVAVTFFLFIFNKFAKHVNRGHLILFHHAPEVPNGDSERSLGGYNFFS